MAIATLNDNSAGLLAVIYLTFENANTIRCTTLTSRL